jgi:hypothetical protein
MGLREQQRDLIEAIPADAVVEEVVAAREARVRVHDVLEAFHLAHAPGEGVAVEENGPPAPDPGRVAVMERHAIEVADPSEQRMRLARRPVQPAEAVGELPVFVVVEGVGVEPGVSPPLERRSAAEEQRPVDELGHHERDAEADRDQPDPDTEPASARHRTDPAESRAVPAASRPSGQPTSGTSATTLATAVIVSRTTSATLPPTAPHRATSSGVRISDAARPIAETVTRRRGRSMARRTALRK